MINWTNIENKYKSNLETLQKMNPYELLEVGVNVNLTDLKKAYRKKMKLYHPDKADEFMKKYNQEVTKLINNAYQELVKLIS